MSILTRWFGTKYSDDNIVSRAEDAIANDPMINDLGTLVVTSVKGVVTLTGHVSRESEKDRIEGVVRNALRNAGLKYESILNKLEVQ